MPFKFVHLCDLLARLEAIEERDPPLLPADRRTLTRKTTEQWFHNHRRTIDDPTTDGVALLSSLFPERRTDRVYYIQEAGLVRYLARCLKLGISRINQLYAFRTRGNGDLAACVERVLKQAENPKGVNDVTVEEVDAALHQLAARCRFSGSSVKLSFAGKSVEELLGPLYFRLQSREAKWLTRLVLKDLSPVVLEERLVQKCYHFLLPQLLNFQSTFEAAITVLRGPLLKPISAKPAEDCEHNLLQYAAKCLTPKIGVKIGRPQFDKARSMKHCLKMISNRWFSLERKYDGEYCQIHIDLTKGEHYLRIFSKSGKDSTQDRKGVHNALQQCLRIGEADCKIKQNCILEGELLVFSTKENVILPFHKIRNHVARSGVFLGTEKDSQPHNYEQLMVVFYDLLLLDDNSVMLKPYEERRSLLKKVVQREPGKAEFASREKMNFSSPTASARLVAHFARIISDRQEGLVLKPCDEPYFSIETNGRNGGRFIKLKKDYIQNLGDTADFAVVGASYNAGEAKRIGGKNIRWTTFYIACLENKYAVDRFDARPTFRVIEALNSCISRKDLKTLSQIGHLRAEPFVTGRAPRNYDLRLDESASLRMDVTFTEPFVFEVLGSSFDKPPNKTYFTLRHPRVLKIHWDRTFKDAVSCEELRDLAEQARKPIDASSQEDEHLLRLICHSSVTSAEFPALGLAGSRKAVMAREQTPSPPTSPESHGVEHSVLISNRSPGSLAPPKPTCNQSSSSTRTGPSDAGTQSPRRSKTARAATLIRVDTAELLPGESRSGEPVHDGASDNRGSLRRTMPPTSLVSPAEVTERPVEGPPLSSSVQARQSRADRKRKVQEDADPVVALPTIKRLKALLAEPQTDCTNLSTVGREERRQTMSKKGSPLADITDKSPQRPPVRDDLGEDTLDQHAYVHTTLPTRSNKLTATASMPAKLSGSILTSSHCHHTEDKASKFPFHSSLPVVKSSDFKLVLPLPRTSSPQSAKCFYASHLANPTLKDRCIFSKAAIYVAPCIAEQRWVVDDLLPAHGAIRIHNLSHLKRETMELSPTAEIVGESQAYKGLMKIVLLESKRMQESAAVIRQVMELGLNEGVDFYDWRVLESFAEIECSGERDSGRRLSKKLRYHCGGIRYDGIPKRSVYVCRVVPSLVVGLEDPHRVAYRKKLWAEILQAGGVVASRTKPVMGPSMPCIELAG